MINSKLLEEYTEFFDGSLGQWKDTYYDIELQPGAQPYHARAFPIPRIHEKALRLEVERLIKEGMLKEIYNLLSKFLGTPPNSFDWEYMNKDGYQIIKNLTKIFKTQIIFRTGLIFTMNYVIGL